jgi:hypothetical protein
MYESDRPLTLLYLINVTQPVPLGHLKSQLHRLNVETGRRGQRQEGVETTLDALVHRGLVLKKGDRYSVTTTGLGMLASLGMSRVRDKNRLLLLNKVL